MLVPIVFPCDPFYMCSIQENCSRGAQRSGFWRHMFYLPFSRTWFSDEGWCKNYGWTSGWPHLHVFMTYYIIICDLNFAFCSIGKRGTCSIQLETLLSTLQHLVSRKMYLRYFILLKNRRFSQWALFLGVISLCPLVSVGWLVVWSSVYPKFFKEREMFPNNIYIFHLPWFFFLKDYLCFITLVTSFITTPSDCSFCQACSAILASMSILRFARRDFSKR